VVSYIRNLPHIAYWIYLFQINQLRFLDSQIPLQSQQHIAISFAAFFNNPPVAAERSRTDEIGSANKSTSDKEEPVFVGIIQLPIGPTLMKRRFNVFTLVLLASDAV